ncbi:uncharacterized protein YndB with AHSA1/START domain/uncharacterized glyoxalase superfamily protein PhnB [Pseudarthrobacter sp. PvP022]
MMTDYPTQDRSFTLTRILAASRHAVFTAWTDPEHLAWFYNPDMPTPATAIEVDLRVGGTWKQQMIVDEDLSYPTGGVYLEIVPDERLVFRWGAAGGWPELDGENELTAPVVTVQLNDLGTETELVLTVQFSEHLDIEEVQKLMLGGTQEGWGATIDRVKDSTAMTTGTNGRMAGPQIYVFFPGTAREALNFYADVFGGELSLHTYENFGRSDGPPEAVAHGVLNGVVALAGSDAAEGQTTVRLEGMMLSLLGTAEPAVLHEWFDKLSVGGSVLDPLSPKPWGAFDGQVIDRHGLHWLVGYEPAA